MCMYTCVEDEGPKVQVLPDMLYMKVDLFVPNYQIGACMHTCVCFRYIVLGSCPAGFECVSCTHVCAEVPLWF